MARILITGAAGFMGRWLVAALQAQHELFALARHAPADPARANVQWIEQDLAQPLDAARLPQQIDAVIHLAQSRHYRDFPAQASDIFAVNVQGTFRLLEYARAAGAQSFVLASTGGLYGYRQTPFVETDSASPEKLIASDPQSALNFYFISKYTAELLAGNYRPFLRAVILRFFFVYGPGQQGMLIPNLAQRVKQRQPITIQGNPGLRLNPIYVADAVRVFDPAMRLPESAVFNVAGDEAVSLTELVELIAVVAGERADITHTDAAPPGDLIGDNRRMKQVLGTRPQVSLRAGLGELIRSI